MKKINIYVSNKNIGSIILLGMFLLIISCKKYTELNPLDSLAESTAFTNAAGVELVMNGVYQQAAVGTYDGGGGRGYPFGAASIEQSEMRGEDMVNLATFYAITYQATYSTSSPNNVNHWDNLYNLINQANIFIAGVKEAGQKGVITEEQASHYEGEARFLRALSHHELLLNFCKPYADNKGDKTGIPYRDTPINTPETVQKSISVGRGTVAEAYQKILTDLDYAEQNLPEEQSVGGYSRATKGAAIALKTRIKLHMGDWQGVIKEGAKLGTGGASPYTSPIGGYILEANPETPFTSFSNNSESIFSIANSAASNGDVNGALPSMLGPSTTGGRGLVSMSPNLYNSSFWVNGDKRKTNLLIQSDPDAGGDGLYYTYKYRDPTTKTDWAPILRYAEVLLNVAEAYARNGQLTNAFSLLNNVRNRSVPESAKYTEQPSDLIQAILNERRVEFAAEGLRWPDIHRLALDAKYGTSGIPAKLNPTQISEASYNGTTMITPARAAISYSNFRFLWPIPNTETNSNPTLRSQQNPGY